MVAISKTVRVAPYYKTHQMKSVWQIVRTLNEHVLCICRNEAEAIRLTGLLNDDISKE